MESAKLYITGLPMTICNDELEVLFSQYGEVSHCRTACIKLKSHRNSNAMKMKNKNIFERNEMFEAFCFCLGSF